MNYKYMSLERNLRKRALLSAVITKMIKGKFCTILFKEDGGITPILKEVNGRLGAKLTPEFNLMDEYLVLYKVSDGSYEKIPVDSIMGIKHNGLMTCINSNGLSKYCQDVITIQPVINQ